MLATVKIYKRNKILCYCYSKINYFDAKILCYCDLVLKIYSLNYKQKKAKLPACFTNEEGENIDVTSNVVYIKVF